MTTHRLLQILVAALGVVNLLTGLALLFAPQWFFENIGNYPPFNRHYEGDLGAFVTAIGIGLLWAARNPHKYRALIGVALLANTLHLFNHIYDDLLIGASLQQIISGVTIVALGTALLALAFFLASSPQKESA